MTVDWIHAALAFMFIGLWIFIGWIMLHRGESTHGRGEQQTLKPHGRPHSAIKRPTVPWHYGRRHNRVTSTTAEE